MQILTLTPLSSSSLSVHIEIAAARLLAQAEADLPPFRTGEQLFCTEVAVSRLNQKLVRTAFAHQKAEEKLQKLQRGSGGRGRGQAG